MVSTPTFETWKAAYWERGETLVSLGQQYGVCWLVAFYSRIVVERLRDYGLTGGSKAKTMYCGVPTSMRCERKFGMAKKGG